MIYILFTTKISFTYLPVKFLDDFYHQMLPMQYYDFQEQHVPNYENYTFNNIFAISLLFQHRMVPL